jgi:tRNA U38,U39,U40 pseudouridine synthase TruA
VTHPVRRVIESVTVSVDGDGLVVEVTAPSFVWGMVRKIVAALREVVASRLSLTELEAALRGERRLTVPLAEPEPLVLWEVAYPIDWELHWSGPNRRQSERVRSVEATLVTRRRVLQALDQAPRPGRTERPPEPVVPGS